MNIIQTLPGTDLCSFQNFLHDLPISTNQPINMRTNRLLYFLDIFAITICNLIRLCSSELLDSVLFVGDSDVYFWGRQGQSSQTIPGSLNVGVSGYTCQSVLNRIDGFLSDYQPTLVILKCGTNDMWGLGQVSPEEAFERFTKVTDKIILSGATTIAMSTKPVSHIVQRRSFL